MQNILIIGYGYIGKRLANLLQNKHHHISVIKKTISGESHDGIKMHIGDVCNIDYSSIIHSIDVIYYLVAPNHKQPSSYHDVYVKGIERLLQAIKSYSEQMPRVILSSTTGVYAYHDGRWVDEKTPTLVKDKKYQSILEGEAMLNQSPVPSMILRFGGIYGEGRHPLIDKIRAHQVACSPEARYTNKIHVDDCIGILDYVAGLQRFEPLYLAVDSHPVEYNRLLSWLATKIGVALDENVASTSTNIQKSNKQCSNALITASGYQFKFPSYIEGYSNILSNDIH